MRLEAQVKDTQKRVDKSEQNALKGYNNAMSKRPKSGSSNQIWKTRAVTAMTPRRTRAGPRDISRS